MRSLVSALVGLVLMLVAFPVYAGRMLTASSCSQVDVQTQVNKVIDNPDDPDTVIVPSGSCKWTDGVTLTRKSVIIKGAGSGVSGSPCPCTIITDGTASGSGTGGQFFKILLDANQKARVAHLQIIDGTADTRANGIIAFYSTVINPASLPLVRADHLKYTATSGTGGNTLLMGQNVLGVWDSNTISTCGLINALAQHSVWNAAGGFGDGSYADPTNFGSSQAVYFENNTTTDNCGRGQGLTVFDSAEGSRNVSRFNSYTNNNQTTHGTETGAGGARGLRKIEIYNNTFTYTFDSWGTVANLRGGVGVFFGNTVTVPSSNNGPLVKLTALRTRIQVEAFGTCDGTGPYDLNDTTGGPGGNGIYASGTHTGANSTDSLTDSTKAWTINQFAFQSSGGNVFMVRNLDRIGSHRFPIASLIKSNTATTLTMEATDTSHEGPHGFNTGDRYEIRKPLACIDQPTRGQSDLISGNPPTPRGWVRNALEPFYYWTNTVIGGAYAFGKVNATPTLQENRDYYCDISCLNLSAGIGVGTLTSLPATCTTGAAYWATDQGKWDTTHTGPDGQLYKCVATNRWSLYYIPYTYPHPLRTSGVLADSPTSDSPTHVTLPAGPPAQPTGLHIRP